jgi:chromate reductase, NAD(P)H dehydrogenase (quinone)
MILIINGTNRPNNKTKHISEYCKNYLSDTLNEEVRYLNLEQITSDIISDQMYNADGQARFLNEIQDELIVPIHRWIVISPEYNGSFPGILKLFFDALSVRKYKESFAGKKVGLIGTSTGRAGNLRGMEHLTSFLNYLRITVFHNKLPVSSIGTVLDNDGQIDESQKVALNVYLDDYVKWSL